MLHACWLLCRIRFETQYKNHLKLTSRIQYSYQTWKMDCSTKANKGTGKSQFLQTTGNQVSQCALCMSTSAKTMFTLHQGIVPWLPHDFLMSPNKISRCVMYTSFVAMFENVMCGVSNAKVMRQHMFIASCHACVGVTFLNSILEVLTQHPQMIVRGALQ